jgi:hypothetical protein
MSERLYDAPGEFLARVAAKLGTDFDRLHAAASKRPMWFQPGKTVEGEKPLPIGSRVNLRREMPNGKNASKDVGWVVFGYSRDKNGRWDGYGIVRGPFGAEIQHLSRCEAFDLVEKYTGGQP